MKRLWRWTFNGIGALSLLIFVCSGALWMRGYWAGDVIYLGGSHWLIGIESVQGQIGAYVFYRSRNDLSGIHYYSAFPDDFLVRGWGWPTPHEGWGFTIAGGPIAAPLAPDAMYEFMVPNWFILLISAAMPLLGLQRWSYKRKIKRQGLCAACGYDLRATPDRCPECGMTPRKNSN